MTPVDQEFSLYEQEILSFFGLKPEGHPYANRIILHHENFPLDLYPLRKEFAWNTVVTAPAEKSYPVFQKYEGGGGSVGPVHAGILNGHFRFSVLREILRLEPRLGYMQKHQLLNICHLKRNSRCRSAYLVIVPIIMRSRLRERLKNWPVSQFQYVPDCSVQSTVSWSDWPIISMIWHLYCLIPDLVSVAVMGHVSVNG
jgi:hypothetical protein